LKQKVEVLNLSEPLKYTSHSFKATALSYLAKYGCSFEDRLALGYHVDQVRMALRYSRDGASRPLRVLETCLTDIRTGKFRPDVTRSGRFVRSLDPGAAPVGGDVAENLQVKQEVILASSGVFEAGEVVDISSDHVTTCSDSSSDDNAVVMPKNPTRTLLIPQGVDVWKHVKLKTVHLAPEGYVRILACGRKISENYQKGGVDVRFDIIKCRQCFNSSILKDA
jgi:phosphotransferase system IIA component